MASSPVLACGRGGCSFSHKNKASQEVNTEQVENSDANNKWFLKMKHSTLIRIVFILFGLLLIVCPVALQAEEMELSLREIESGEIVEAPKQMSQKQMNDLFGEDPYLGQTSYLQSPDGFHKRKK